MIRRLLAVLLLAVPLHAQEARKIQNPPRFNRRALIAGVSLPATSKIADAITTRQLIDRGGWGRHPSPAKQAGINLGIFAAQSTAFYFTEGSRHKWIRWTGRAYIGHAIFEHSRLAACNAGINTRSPVIQSCGPLAPF